MLGRQTLKQPPDREQQAARGKPADQADWHAIRRNTSSPVQPTTDIGTDGVDSSKADGREPRIRSEGTREVAKRARGPSIGQEALSSSEVNDWPRETYPRTSADQPRGSRGERSAMASLPGPMVMGWKMMRSQ